ncbi:MAG: Riboflavin synthase, alpha subunit [Candidatus Daviesbacteria bacterium GW2011_GWA2_42_7]|uniref:Riboflavin synthase n=1 Tax=Candidatus Daviesbacteria bacterium GW2011_GWA2_42_7 TaxID=1618425 RepID=A0A0G1B8B1_9BACT|nr:MAG: Riboflavin synthase, alpha subunit [Candidatus Daviesbacteria bacterium GW2011_GWA2_42_7]
MFTGIISHTTKIKAAKKVSAGLAITFERPRQWADLVLGESIVNLERALKVGDRLSGHFVQGHIDCVGKVLSTKKVGASEITIGFPGKFNNFVIDKGSITVNGVALTIVETERNRLSVALIPYTLQHTNLGNLKVSDRVNLEFDMLGKYAAKAL